MPATIVFLVGAIGYLLLAAFAPSVMGWQIVDGLPFAWIAAISQVLLTWALTFAYLRKADCDVRAARADAPPAVASADRGSAR